MKPMYNLLVLFPEHLNLNGDAANAGVLARRMNWYGIDAAIDFFSPGDQLPSFVPDFVLLGHGSAAAWAALSQELDRIRPTLKTWIESGVFGLAVNSAQELLHSAEWRVFDGELQPGDRVSKFAVADAEFVVPGTRVLGYQNSIFNAPLIERNQNFIGTQLHGPVLAKNEAMADWFIRGISGQTALEPSEFTKEQLQTARTHEQGIWAFEEALASE